MDILPLERPHINCSLCAGLVVSAAVTEAFYAFSYSIFVLYIASGKFEMILEQFSI